MTKEKYNFYSETTKLIDKEDLRTTRLFWFMIGFLSAVILTLIFLTNV